MIFLFILSLEGEGGVWEVELQNAERRTQNAERRTQEEGQGVVRGAVKAESRSQEPVEEPVIGNQ
jgi:hypothetical protein